MSATRGAISQHIQHLADVGRAASYRATRRQVLHRLQDWLPCQILGAEADHIEAWAATRRPRLAEGSWAVEMAHVRGFFAWAIERGLRDDDPTRWVGVAPTPHRLPRPIPDEDLERALASVEHPADLVILLLAVDGGLRRAEIAGLVWSDVDLRNRRARVIGKGNKERVVPLSEQLVEALRDLPTRRGHVIQRRDGGGALKPGAVAARVRHLLGESTLHQLRHHAGTRWVRVGGIRVGQQLLGHEDPKTTAGYARVDMSEAAGVVDAAAVREQLAR